MNSFSPKKTASLLASVLFIAMSAQVTIDVPVNGSAIPISGQSFAVLLVGFLLGKNGGVAALLLYLIVGITGFPVFADGAGGIKVFKGGSGGFLYGFVFGAALVGYLADKGWGTSLLKSCLAMLLGTLVIITFGVIQLSFMFGWQKAMEYGFYPFVEGAVIKIVLGGLMGWLIKRKRA